MNIILLQSIISFLLIIALLLIAYDQYNRDKLIKVMHEYIGSLSVYKDYMMALKDITNDSKQ